MSQTEYYSRIGAKMSDSPETIKRLRKKFVAKNHPDRQSAGKIDPEVFKNVMSYKPQTQNNAGTKMLTGKVQAPPKPPSLSTKGSSSIGNKIKNNALAGAGGIAGAGMAASNIKNLSNKETRSKGIKGTIGQAVGTVGGAVLGKKLGFKNKNIFGAASGTGAIGGFIGSKL